MFVAKICKLKFCPQKIFGSGFSVRRLPEPASYQSDSHIFFAHLEMTVIYHNLLKAIEQGIITTTTKQRMIELEQTKNELELKIIKEEMKRPKITKEGLMFWLRRFQKMEVIKKEHKQRLINSFVNSVYLYDDKLVISFNYKEECKTVTLKEINGSSIECFGAPKNRLAKASLFFYPSRTAWQVICL